MDRFPYIASRPLNFGHRGSPRAAPENTLASFQQARQDGADGVELDVQLTADGHVVVIHDATVDRTTNGRGAVRDLTLDQIRTLDAGSWFDPQYSGQQVPALEQVCEWAGNETLLNIELKTVALRSTGLEPKVIAIVRQFGLEGRVLLSSFNPFALLRARSLAPSIPTGLLYSGELPLMLRRAWLRPLIRPAALHPQFGLVTEPFLRWARGKGLRVNVWTVDTAEEMQQLIVQRVDAIITNQPDALTRLLKR